MAIDDTDLEALADGAARVLDLPITEAYRPGILANLRNLAGLYDTVRGFDEAAAPEPLAIYRP